MTWIVTNGSDGEKRRYVEVRDGGFWWSEDRSKALALANQQSAEAVALGMTIKAYPLCVAQVVGVVDRVLA